MIVRSAVLVVGLIVAGCSLQNHAVSTQSANPPEQEILQAESRLAEALNTLDDAALDRLWDDRLVFVGSNGHSTTKAQRLKSVRDARGNASNRVTSSNDDVRVQFLGPAAAIVSVVSSWHGMDATPSQVYRATHVWTHEDGTWKLVLAHVSKVTP